MPHYSQSQINMFAGCQAQWMFRYVEGLKMPPSGPMLFGNVFDDALSKQYEQKIESERDLSVADVTDLFSTDFDARQGDVEWYDIDPADIREKGQELTEKHMTVWAPGLMPAAVQERIEVSTPGDGYSIVMIPDLLTRDDVVVDVKTTSKTPSKASFSHQFQIWLYSLGFSAKYRRPVKGGRLLHHVRLKASTKLVQHEVDVSSQKQSFAAQQVRRVAKAIEVAKENSLFIPNRNYMMCTKKQCGFWDVCHQRFGPNEEVKDATD